MFRYHFNISQRVMLWSLALGTVAIPVAYTQVPRAPKVGSAAKPRWAGNIPPLPPSYWAWTKEPWTGDDQPYHKIRLETFAASQAKNRDGLLAEYKAAAQHHPNDPKAQFRWAYMAYRLGKLNGAFQALEKAPSPHNYEYDRLHFLAWVVYLWPENRLKDIGQRLTKRDPNDTDVKYWLVDVLRPERPVEGKAALQYTHELIAAHPKDANFYSLLGGVYYRMWMTSKSQVDADQAIAGYKQYLQLAPPNAAWRKTAEAIIQRIQTVQAQHKK